MSVVASFSFLLISSPLFAKTVDPGPRPAAAEVCAEIGQKLGQLFYVNVDGYQYAGRERINPEYAKMVRELNIGGVIAHPSDGTYQQVEEAMEQLKAASKQPLLIGVDSERLRTTADAKTELDPKRKNGSGEGSVTIGFGVYMGTIGDFGTDFPVACAERVGYLEAFLHRAMGFNQALGPTIEHAPRRPFLSQSADKVATVLRPLIKGMDEMGLRSTLKHYPYTPDSYNLHDQSTDTKYALDEVDKRLEIFKELAPSAGIVMSTHLYNSNVDPNDMATFSEKWIGRLRKVAKFDGLIMTDGLFMLREYDDNMKQMAAKWNPREAGDVKSEQAIFMIRAILAGHDLALLEGNAGQTRQVFRDVKKVACLDTAMGRRLRERVLESYDRIQRYKSKNRDSLTNRIRVPEELVTEAKSFEFAPPCEGRDPSEFTETIAGKVVNRKEPGTSCPPDMWRNAKICRDKDAFASFQAKVRALGIVPVQHFVNTPASEASGVAQ